MVLDRELTADETRKLTTGDPGSAFSYLRELGGRPLVYASVMEHAPNGTSGTPGTAVWN